jgi:hypothetical protein
MGEINANRSQKPKSVQIGKFSVTPSVLTLAINNPMKAKSSSASDRVGRELKLRLIVLRLRSQDK